MFLRKIIIIKTLYIYYFYELDSMKKTIIQINLERNTEIENLKLALENVKRGKVNPIEQVAGELGITLR